MNPSQLLRNYVSSRPTDWWRTLAMVLAGWTLLFALTTAILGWNLYQAGEYENQQMHRVVQCEVNLQSLCGRMQWRDECDTGDLCPRRW